MRFKNLLFTVVAASFLVSTAAHALDIGLEASVRVEASDNVGGDDRGAEETGQIGYALIGVYGDQRGRIFEAGFSGELQTQRVLSDDDANPTTLNNFFGAANILISPSFSWYFGNVLGTVQTSEELLSFEDEDTNRRNVFVTGPTFNYDINPSNTVLAEVLYLNQNQDDIELADLVTARFDWRRDTQRGNTFGIEVSDIFTNEPEFDEDQLLNINPVNLRISPDTNRLSGSAFWERNRGRLTWYASLGATRFSTDEDSTAGANAEARVTRRLGPQTDLTFAVGTDLIDNNILTIDSLTSGAGRVPDATGIFRSNNISLIYNTNTTVTSFEVGLRGSATEFQALDDNFAFDDPLVDGLLDPSLDDNFTISAYGVLSRQLTRRWNLNLRGEIENQRFDNVDDEVDSIRVDAVLGFQINQSFSLSAGLRSTYSEGINTRENVSLAEDGTFEISENRVLVQLTWAPPSRASQEQVVQLKQLLR